ncbi:MAG: 23S rRNA (uracil(1939)-C(5))-methyltransferase RlmD [Erysipelotrichales bacterium]|nr:23S rRNA (uracil(1939)-C(5))-methyltransferase RlmD [Erysipelotrichales bacterium]
MKQTNKEKQCMYKKCGGCDLAELSYEDQLALKQKNLENLLGKFGKPEPILRMHNPTHYRNKVQMAYFNNERRVLYGTFMPGTHTFTPVKDCLIADRKAAKIFEDIAEIWNDLKLSVFQERSGNGFLRYVMVRHSEKTNQYMVVFVTGNAGFPKKDIVLKTLLDRNPYIKTVVQSVNNRPGTSVILGKNTFALLGNGYIEDLLCEKRFRISAASFYQVNARQTEVLYRTVIETANLRKNETVIDAYCGTGTIGIIASGYVKQVIGVELNPAAVKDAEYNAKINKASNVSFTVNDAGKYMESLAMEGKTADTVIMDPPRAGADERFLESLVLFAPKKIVYVSCNPETLKNNLDYLTGEGYAVQRIQPVDMFPFTSHVESIALLCRK